MAKIKKSVKHVHSPGAKKKVNPDPKWAVPFILILTFAAYIPALNAGFVNWDDEVYIINNPLLKDISNLKAIITTPIQGNYHPLTMISLALNYAVSGFDAWSYHLFNLLFHLVNCWLVYRLASLLSKQQFIIAFGTAVLFAIHPMHVESVAWVSERKDVLYTLFFVAGLISYVKFIDTNSKKQFGLSIVFLILSLLSKPAAVVFPLVLLCIDLLRRRPFTVKLILEKIPFAIPALAMGLLTYYAQTDVGATGSGIFPMSTRVLMAFYGFMMYIVKLILPFNLSPFYPFPAINMALPVEYYIAPVFFIIIAVLSFLSLKKYREFAFGFSFYLANLILVLQVLPVGSAVIAERYSYVPYIGIFYFLSWIINRLTTTNSKKGIYILVSVSVLLSILTYRQAGIWHDGASLWDHVISTNPNSKAYTNRGLLLRKEKEYNKAVEYYTKAIQMNIADHEPYINRGNVYFDLKKYDLAYADYIKALQLKPGLYTTYDNMGALFSTQQKYDSALVYLNLAIKTKPDYQQSYSNRGLTYMQLARYDEAIKDFQTFLTFEPNSADVINTIGYCLRNQRKFPEAISYIDKAIQIKAQPAFYLNRSYAYYGMGNLELAKKDAMTAKQAGIQIEPAYLKVLGL